MSAMTPGDPTPPSTTRTPVDGDQNLMNSMPCLSYKDSIRKGTSLDTSDFMLEGDVSGNDRLNLNDHLEINKLNHSDCDMEDSTSKPMEVDWDPNEILISEHEGRPSLDVSDNIMGKLATPWTRSVVVKVFGKKIGFQTLENRLRFLWKPSNLMQVMDLDNDYFLVRFRDIDDWNHALCDGPWIVLGAYLLIQPWTPDFDVEQGISTVTAWVRFPRLKVQFYNHRFLSLLGNRIGKTIKIDLNTQQASRGKFARVAVSMDISKPLVDKLMINKRWQKIEYESFPSLCFECGRVGHTKPLCPYILNKECHESGAQGDGGEVQHQHVPTREENHSTGMEQSGDKFGPWLQVRPYRRNPVKKIVDVMDKEFRRADSHNPQKTRGSTLRDGKQGGSRFNVLSGHEEDLSSKEKENIPLSSSTFGNELHIAHSELGGSNNSITIQGGHDVAHKGLKAQQNTSQRRPLQARNENSARSPIIVGPSAHFRSIASTEQRVEPHKDNFMPGPITVGPLIHSKGVASSERIKDRINVNQIKDGPVTVGPLFHSKEMSNSGKKEFRSKVNKLGRKSSVQGGAISCEDAYEFEGHPSSLLGKKKMADSALHISSKGRKSFKLGKRKTLTIQAATNTSSHDSENLHLEQALHEVEAPNVMEDDDVVALEEVGEEPVLMD